MAKMCTVVLKGDNGVTFATKDDRDDTFIKQKALDIYNSIWGEPYLTMEDVVRIESVQEGFDDSEINPREDEDVEPDE
jgi:hypothetical protein